MKYVVHYDIAAIVILTVISLHFFSKKTVYTHATRSFQVLMSIIYISCISDLISVFTICTPENYPMWFNYLINIIYFSSINFVALEFFLYLVKINKEEPHTELLRRLFIIPAWFSIIATISTPFTKCIFYYNENNVYTHGKYITLMYIASALYVIITWWLCNIYI